MNLPTDLLPAVADGVFPGLAVGSTYSTGRGSPFEVVSPIDAAITGSFGSATSDDVSKAVSAAHDAFCPMANSPCTNSWAVGSEDWQSSSREQG